MTQTSLFLYYSICYFLLSRLSGGDWGCLVWCWPAPAVDNLWPQTTLTLVTFTEEANHTIRGVMLQVASICQIKLTPLTSPPSSSCVADHFLQTFLISFCGHLNCAWLGLTMYDDVADYDVPWYCLLYLASVFSDFSWCHVSKHCPTHCCIVNLESVIPACCHLWTILTFMTPLGSVSWSW